MEAKSLGLIEARAVGTMLENPRDICLRRLEWQSLSLIQKIATKSSVFPAMLSDSANHAIKS